MKPVVCLPMEVKSRDLDGRLYLAMRCAQAGHPVLFGIRARVRRFVRKDLTGPAYFISKGNRPVEEIYGPLEKHGGRLFLLDEEGAGSLCFDVHVNHPFVLTQNHVEKVFVWGELQKDYLIKQGTKPDKLLVTGNPRFDLCKPEHIGFYRELSKRLNKPDKYILIASNQVSANPALGLESTKRHLKSIFKGRHGIGGHSVDSFMKQHKTDTLRLRKLIELAKAVSAGYPELTVVFRPHPAEEMSFYDEVFNEKNILVTREGSSLEWIVDEMAHIHVDCTTGIEAFMAGKEVLSYVTTDDTASLTEATITASTVYHDQETILKKIGELLANGEKSSTLPEAVAKEKREKLRQLFANISLDSSTTILQAFPPHDETIPPHRMRPKSWLYRTAKKLRIAFKGNRLNDLDLRAKRKFPGLTLSEVEQKVALFQATNHDMPKVRIREYDINTFLMEPL